MVTLEQVEKLREHANISYEEAKKALEETNGDILEAIVNLEKQNRIKAPEGGGYYNSKKHHVTYDNKDSQKNDKREFRRKNHSNFKEQMGKLFGFCAKVIDRGNKNSLEVIRDGVKTFSIPVTVLALFLIFAFWFTIPLMVVGLFFGYRYAFTGPDLGKEKVNNAMGTVADAAENLKKGIKGDNTNGENSDN